MKIARIITILLALVGCADELTPQQVRGLTQAKANEVVAKTIYIRDPRVPNTCFAYHWGGAANGGPALAAIDCDKIPPDLLFVGDPAAYVPPN